jgi:branched-chain amino acid transport system ATP-binding protein
VAREQAVSALLEVRSLTKRFGGLVANQDITLRVAAGEIVGLIGPNGAGKTTLFNCIAGFYPPSSGNVFLDGAEVTGARPEKMAHVGVARTFQLVRTFATMTVLENVIVATLIRDKRLPIARERAKATLDFCGLSARATLPAASLTVAEQRRLEVARALGLEPKLLLLDEVMAGLNPAEVQEAAGLVQKIRGHGIACLIVEHVMEGIMPIANRVIVLDYGRKIAEGTPDEVRHNPAVIAAYLGEV